jgi:hypothetical protein
MFTYWYRDDDDNLVEFTDRVQEGWAENPGTDGLVMNAEEGGVGNCVLRVEDPDGDWDFPRGHRMVVVIESDATSDDYDGRVYLGFTWIRRFKRDLYKTGAARIIEMDLVDVNTIFERRIWVGSDANRPAETDVERVTWALTTAEGALIDDQTYFSTDGPYDMDAVEYRGQSFRQTFDDVSQQSGKNWYLWQGPGASGVSLWYGPRGTTDFSSDIRISNVISDVEGDPTGTFYPSLDSDLARDPSRVYSGIYRSYANSYAYTQNAQTATDFARRDTTESTPNIKTLTKAIIRNERELSDISTEEDVISTAIIVPRAQVNAVLQGQRIQVKYTHFDGYESFVWMRVVTRTVRELGLDEIEIAMELSPDEPVNQPSHDVYGTLQKGRGFSGPEWDKIWFASPSDYAVAGCPTVPHQGLITPLQEDDPLINVMAPAWTWYGWQIDGTGTVDVTFYISTIGITPISVTFCICLNGDIVASLTQYNADTGYGNDGTVSIANLAVVPGDVITARIIADPFTGVPFFMAPRGTGSCGEALTITDGFLV